MKRIGLLACVGMMLFLGIANAQDNEPQIKRYRIKNVRSAIVAWWIDPANNPEPIEVEASRKADEWASEKLSDPRRAANPYASSAKIYQSEDLEKPILPREAPSGSTPNMFALPAGVAQVVNVASQNILLVYGTTAGIAQLEKTIAVLDQPIQQVEIEAQYISLADAKESLAALFPAESKNAGQKTVRVLQNLDAVAVQTRLQELVAQKQARIFNSPRATILNNLTQKLGSIMTVPAALTIRNDAGETKNVLGSTGKFENESIEAGIAAFLNVTPTIQNNGTITLHLRPTKTLIMRVSTNPIVEQPAKQWEPIPIRTLEAYNCIANVRDGETIALIGLSDFYTTPQFSWRMNQKAGYWTDVALLLTTRIVRRDAAEVPGVRP